jgi:hypothetical protein
MALASLHALYRTLRATSSSQPGLIDDLEAVCLGLRFVYCPTN